MAEFNFNFCPTTRVAEIIAPEEPTVRDFNGWDYTPRPVLPYRRKFKVTLEGLRWYYLQDGTIDYSANPERNAGVLEYFYEDHRKWRPFNFLHERLGLLELRFESPLSIPKALPDSGGLVPALEIMMIHHNPTYAPAVIPDVPESMDFSDENNSMYLELI